MSGYATICAKCGGWTALIADETPKSTMKKELGSAVMRGDQIQRVTYGEAMALSMCQCHKQPALPGMGQP